jgi:hypothetical protein
LEGRSATCVLAAPTVPMNRRYRRRPSRSITVW